MTPLGVLLAALPLFAGAAQEERQVVVREGTNFAVTGDPAGGPLFTDLQGTLWRLPRDGGAMEALTDGYGDDRVPDLHPDGARLAFQSFRAGNWDIWTLPLDGGEATHLTSGLHDDREPAWSPDGSRIAFSSDRSGTYDIWVLEVASGALSAATSGLGNESWPAWTPDGGLVFVSEPEGREAEIRHLPSGGGPSQAVPGGSGAVSAPAVSPDGTRVAFRRLQREGLTLMGTRFDLGIGAEWVAAPLDPDADANPGAFRGAGADIFPFRPTWLDDETLLYTGDGAIQRLVAGGEPEAIAFSAEFTVTRPPTPRGTIRTEAEGPQPVRGIVRPSLSPDGTRVLYAALGDLWIAPLDGSEAPLPLTRDSFLDTDPIWLPDGSGVIFASDRGGTMDIWEKRVDSAPGSGLVQITSGAGAEVGPALSPDGARVAWLDEAGSLRVGSRDADVANGDEVLFSGRQGLGMPSWSADGATIAVAALAPFSTQFREGWNRIALVAADSGESRMLEGFPGGFGTRDGDGPVFSPDGRSFALSLDGGLAVVPFEGSDALGEPRRIFEGPADFPSWAPDGQSLLALSGADLIRIQVDGSGFETIPLRHEFEIAPPSGTILFQDVGVLDVDAGEVRPGQDVLVEAGRIVSVEPTGAVPGEDTRVVPGEGGVLIPGLIEMHTHPWAPAFGNRFGRVHLAYGVTTVRIPAGPTYRTIAEREAILAGRRVGPRVFLTGTVLDGDRIYYPGAVTTGGGRQSAEAALQLAEELDFDILKTYVRLDDRAQAEAIRRARRMGTFVTSHEIYPAVRSGIHGVEHIKGTSRRGFSPKATDLGYSYQDVRALLAESGAYWVPTLLIYGGWDLALARDLEAFQADPRIHAFPLWIQAGVRAAEAGDPEARRRLMEPMWRTVDAAWREGARIVMGTDTPIIPYGLGLILEIEQFAEAGPGPAAAIRASTSLAAEALGLEDQLGAIRPGMLADLVLLRGNPLEDIRRLREVRAVMGNGRLASLERLLGF